MEYHNKNLKRKKSFGTKQWVETGKAVRILRSVCETLRSLEYTVHIILDFEETARGGLKGD